jgi:hypothetical protein
VTPSFSHANWFRAPLVVLSDRRPAPGVPRTGLESAIEWALHEHDGVWIVGHAEEEPRSGGGDTRSCNGEWAVLGGVSARPRSSLDGWTGYVRANAAYAERIIESVSPGGTVWVNGHRWLLVASALREYGHRGPIGLLLDVPFPVRGQLEVLPWCPDVIAALCQSDLIGFRGRRCADNFESCRARAGRQRPWIEVFPDGAGSVAYPDPAEWGTSFLQLLVSAARREPRRAFLE